MFHYKPEKNNMDILSILAMASLSGLGYQIYVYNQNSKAAFTYDLQDTDEYVPHVKEYGDPSNEWCDPYNSMSARAMCGCSPMCKSNKYDLERNKVLYLNEGPFGVVRYMMSAPGEYEYPIFQHYGM